MALPATVYRFTIGVSDVERGVYETLDLTVAQHPSESMRYLLTRTLAYALSYEDGIAFSKGGLSATDEPPIAVRDPTGLLVAWIDVGSPSAERLHKAAKAAPRVAVFTHVDLALLRREAATRVVHRADEIAVVRIAPAFLDDLERHVGRRTSFEIVRSDGHLYVTIGGASLETELETTTWATCAAAGGSGDRPG